MEEFKFRSKTRRIAVVDIVLSSMSLGLDLLLIFFAGIATTALKEKWDRGSIYIISFIWMVAITCTAATVLQVIAAIKLLTASELGKRPATALRLCRFWRAVTIFFMSLIIFNLLFYPEVRTIFTFGFLLTNVIVRSIALYIVMQFMCELQAAFQQSTSGIIPVYHHQTQNHTVDPLDVYFFYPSPSRGNVEAPPPSYEECAKLPPPTT